MRPRLTLAYIMTLVLLASLLFSRQPLTVAARTSQSPHASSSECTLVELYPGYPMYRGVLTGMLSNWGGLGDWACFEELERMDPQFEKATEDRANIAAARELGINGQPEDWLWENWMQIEAMRGLPAQCYSCVLTSTDIVPLTTTIQSDGSDPRNAAGLWTGPESYVYRAMAFIYGWDHILNAPELLQMYDDIEANENQPGGTYLVIGDAANYALTVGGYTLVPPDAPVKDQEFLMYQAFLAVTPYTPPPMMSAYLSLINEGIADWRVEVYRQPATSLREYLANHFALKGIEF